MEDALLAAICAQPDDIAARLVYADYLLEQSDPAKRERGEFVLAQCRGDGGGTPASGGFPYGRFRNREVELLAKYRDAWLAPLAGLVSNAAFTRGFPDRITMWVDRFADTFAAVSRVTPVARLQLLGATDYLPILAECEQLRGVVSLDLTRGTVSAAGLREFLASPHLTRLHSLNLGDNGIGDAGADALAESPLLSRLRYLGVARNGLTPSGVSRLLSRLATGAPALQMLNLRGNPLSPGNWAERVLDALPPKMHPALRLSLEGQLRKYRLTKPPPDAGPLPRLKAAKLPPEFAAWVKALDVTTAAGLVAVLGRNPLPAEVHRAFAAVCGRRVEWSVQRELRGERVLPVPELAGPGPKELAEFVQDVGRFAVHAREVGMKVPPNTKRGKKDARPNLTTWLRDWLLRLLEHHAAGTLDPEGRTR